MLFVVQFVSIALLLVSTKNLFGDRETFTSIETFDEISDFSKTSNIIHIVLDGSQSDIFQNLFNSGGNSKRFRSAFSGFTVFPQNLGTFPYTQLSVPNFLSGEVFKNHQPKGVFIDSVMSGNNILNTATENKYELDVATGSEHYVKQYSKTKASNVLAIDSFISSGPIQEVSLLYDIALFQALPHFLKFKIYNDQGWFFSSLVAQDGGLQHWYFQHTLFLRKLIDNIRVTRESSVYKYFHIMNTHNPMVVGADCGYLGAVAPTTKLTLTLQSSCTLETLVLLFEKLKKEGVYDSSLIVIHGDHGGWVPNGRKGQSILLPDSQQAPGWVSSLASPFLTIKLPNDQNQFVSSPYLSSLSQIPITIASQLEWTTNFPGKSIFDEDHTSNNQREFYLYSYGALDKAWEADYTEPIFKFLIDGSHLDSQWKLDEIYPSLED